MHSKRQIFRLLVLFAAIVGICDASVVLTAILASGEVRIGPEVHGTGTIFQRTLDIFNNLPFQKVNTGDSVIFQLNVNRTAVGVITIPTSFGPDNYVLSGNITDGGQFILSFSRGIFIGQVEFADESLRFDILPDPDRDNGYLVRSVPSTIYEKEEFPESLLFPEMKEEAGNKRQREIASVQGLDIAHLNLRRGSGLSYSAVALTADTNNILDVMFLFTPQALVAIGGGQRSMDAVAIYSVQLANDAYANSNVPLRMRSVGALLVQDASYKEAGFQNELNHLRYTDGVLDQDVAQRTSLGADSVVLFVANSAYCGLAYQWATSDLTYAVVSTQCLSSVVHEVGHNIGCQHDRTSEHSIDAPGYNFGYCWDTAGSTCSRSIMAYSTCATSSKRTNCPRAAYFSSPLITQGGLGRTTGVTSADNARVLREQVSRAINWAPSKRDGGLIFSVQPSTVALNRCEPVTITGWRIGTTSSDIVNVTINGVPVQRIMSQTLDSVQVLVGSVSTPGIGDIVVTTRSGYTTTLEQAFAYEATSGSFVTDFEYNMGTLWTSSGALQWTIVRYCNSLPCTKAPAAGPSVGAGGSGSFAKLVATESSGETGSLTALFNQNYRSHGCVENVHSISLSYHLWNPNAAQCGGSLTVSMQSITSGAWTTILTAEARQANQDDPWLSLNYTFPDPADVGAIRIIANPYTGMSMCYYFSSVSVDHIEINKTTTCTQDGCNLKTNYPTVFPTMVPSAKPTKSPTFAPTYPLIEVVEEVQFTSTLILAGISAAQFQSDLNNAELFLRTMAATIGLIESALCCVAVSDAPALPAAAPLSMLTAASRMSITYNSTLFLEHLDRSNTVSDNESESPSPLATAAVDQVQLSLMQSVASGNLLQALTAVLPSDWSSELAVELVTASSFSTARSYITAATSTPSMAPTSSADVASWSGSGRSKSGLTWWGVYIGIVAILVTIICSSYAAYFYLYKSYLVNEPEGDQADQFIAIIKASGENDREVPSTTSSMRNACEYRVEEGVPNSTSVSESVRLVPSSPSRQQSSLQPSPSSRRTYLETLFTPRGSLSAHRGSAKSPLHHAYSPVNTVSINEACHQAPYQDIIDSVNRSTSRGDHTPKGSWCAAPLHDQCGGPENESSCSFEMIPRTPRISPRLSVEIYSPTNYRQTARPGSQEVFVAGDRSGRGDTALSRMPFVAGLPRPMNITTIVHATAVPASAKPTTWSPRAISTTPRPATASSSGVTRDNTPHSAPFVPHLAPQQPGIMHPLQTTHLPGSCDVIAVAPATMQVPPSN